MFFLSPYKQHVCPLQGIGHGRKVYMVGMVELMNKVDMMDMVNMMDKVAIMDMVYMVYIVDLWMW